MALQSDKHCDDHIPSGASCWICLDEGPDENGKPLVRNCSCRGDSGYSHFACIVQYAETKSLQMDEKKKTEDNSFIGGPLFTPWKICPNCNQPYKGTLLVDLADEYVSFTKRTAPYEIPIEGVPDTTFPCEPIRYVDALYYKLNVYATKRGCDLNEEVGNLNDLKNIATEIILLIDIIKNHQDQVFGSAGTKKYQMNLFCVLNIEMWTLLQLGTCYEKEVSLQLVEKEIGLKMALEHYEKSQQVAQLFPGGEGVEHNKNNIARVKGKLSGDMTGLVASLPFLRSDYERMRNTNSGAQLALALYNTDRRVEYVRLMDELLSDSRRIHGADHEATKYVEGVKKTLVVSTIWIKSLCYEALHYDNDDKLVVRGPISNERVRRKDGVMENLTIEQDEFSFGKGTPVVCKGLQKAEHLNGEIGDIRSFDKDSGRYEVHFEDESLKPSLVRHQNLRIIFELPGVGGDEIDESYDDVD